MKLLPTESLLTGTWLMHDGRIIADDVCKRIDWLVRMHLHELGRDASGWDTLYRDPVDERLWELVFPRSDAHGGGPPELRYLPAEQAREKYGDIAL